MAESNALRVEALLREQEAAEILGVSVPFLQSDRVTRRHRIPYLKIGRCVRYRATDLTLYLERCLISDDQGSL